MLARRQASGVARALAGGFPRVFSFADPSQAAAAEPCMGGGQSRPVTSLAVRSSVAARGPGGRSSVSGIVATVFGATGFLGRYVVQQLARTGSQVVVPYRGLEDGYKHLKLCGDLGQVVPVPFDIRDEKSIAAAMAKSNVVINLIGRDYETRNFSFEDINVAAPERIARVARQHGGISRVVHLSCLGASAHAPSRQHQTKAQGEAALLAEFPQVQRVFESIRETPHILSIPLPIAKALATPREWLLRRVPCPVPAPTMFTLDYINSLSFPHVVSPSALKFSDLGVTPRPLKGIAIEYLYAYRSGGPQYGQTVGERVSGAGY